MNKAHKAFDKEKVTTDFVVPGGDEPVKQFTKNVNKILKKEKPPVEWREAKMIILHRKRIMRL